MRPYYEDQMITLYNADCRDVAEQIGEKTIDLLLTDPPYGMAFNSGWTASTAVKSDGERQGARVVRTALNSLSPSFSEDMHALVFCHWKSWPDFHDHLCHLFSFRNALIWSKGGGGMGDLRHEYAKDYEVILFGAKGRGRELSGKRSGCILNCPRVPPQKRNLPYEKPVSLLTELIQKHSTENMLILDPFVGSGSTIIASMATKRKVIGIELDEKNCEIAARRIVQYREVNDAQISAIL